MAGRKARAASNDVPELHTISNLETLRLLADPLRISIMQAFASTSAPRTVKQIAAELGAKPTKLYYHFNLLEEHGLVRVAESRVVSGIIEKSYLPAARSFTIDAAIVQVTPGGREAAAATMAALLQTSAAELTASVAAGGLERPADAPARFHVTKSLSRIDPARHAEFLERITALIDEFENVHGKATASDASHALVIAYYPLPGASGTADEGDDR